MDLFQEIELLYFVAFGVFSILGVTVHPFFFAYHLTEVIIRYPTMKNIILSVWEPRLLMTLTFLLLGVLNYYASILAYIWFKEPVEGNCDSILYCFLWVLDATIKGSLSAKFLFDVGLANIAEVHKFGFWFYI